MWHTTHCMDVIIIGKYDRYSGVHLVLLKQGSNVIEVKLLSVVETTNIVCGQLKTLSVQVSTRCSSPIVKQGVECRQIVHQAISCP